MQNNVEPSNIKIADRKRVTNVTNQREEKPAQHETKTMDKETEQNRINTQSEAHSTQNLNVGRITWNSDDNRLIRRQRNHFRFRFTCQRNECAWSRVGLVEVLTHVNWRCSWCLVALRRCVVR